MCTAELPGHSPTVSVSSSSAGGLITAIDSFAKRELRSGIDAIEDRPDDRPSWST